jgi:hypothetical protein
MGQRWPGQGAFLGASNAGCSKEQVKWPRMVPGDLLRLGALGRHVWSPNWSIPPNNAAPPESRQMVFSAKPLLLRARTVHSSVLGSVLEAGATSVASP